MNRILTHGLLVIAFLAGLIVLQLMPPAAANGNDKPPQMAPQFTSADAKDWINSEPLRIDDLVGDVVLLDVWTYECWNCYRSIPWLLSLEEKFADERFRIVGIHTPEFPREKKRANVVAKVAEFGITHPVMMDNDFEYWRALNNRYWPSFYLIDRKGRVRGLFVGETHAGDRRARRVEAAIGELLREGD